MKWVDEKGRIGGWVNLFDLSAILTAALLVGYYGFSTPAMIPPDASSAASGPGKIARKEPKGSPVVIRDVQFVFRDLAPTLAARIRPGNRDTAHPDTTIEILEILGNDPQLNVVNMGGKKVLASVPGEKRMVRVRMKIRGRGEGKTFYYKQQPFIRGKSYTFVTPEYVLVGEALRLDDTFIIQYLPVRRRLRIWARTLLIEQTVADMPRRGDRALPSPNDPEGRFLWLKLSGVFRPPRKPWQEIPDIGDYYWPIPKMRTIGVKLECLCAYSDEKGFYYGSEPLSAGEKFGFKTKFYYLPLKIQKVEALPLDTPSPEGS